MALLDRLLPCKDPLVAQKRAIVWHASGTASNASSLAAGILLVFFGGYADERWVWLGIALVAFGIGLFLILETVATHFDVLGVAPMTLNFKVPPGLHIPRARCLRLQDGQINVIYDDDPVPDGLALPPDSGAGGPVG